ncbi:MAG: hypothetical protein HY959_08295 [Ignavibacteriae bacterium]|nr:hypothetical protein [Ignavibacteriota bacterium]
MEKEKINKEKKRKEILKIVFQKFVSAFLAFLGDYYVSHLLGVDGTLSENLRFTVLIFFFLVFYHFTEWVIFFFFEWNAFEKDFDKLKQNHEEFYEAWKQTLIKIEENKKILLDIQKSKSRTGLILDKFAKSNILVESLSTNLKNDLELDDMLTREKEKEQKDFHDFIASLKYDEFLASHFIHDAKKKEVLQIPSYYFKNRIWEEFVDKAYCYYSIQFLDKKQYKVYIEDPNRKQEEINILDGKTKGSNQTEIKKLFVIEDEYLDEKLKIKDDGIKDYLKDWDFKFRKKYDKIPVKVMKKSDAIGLVRNQGDRVDDIGIFGDIYGIQSINRNDGKFYTDELKIDFHFDKIKTNKQKENFNKLFKNAKMLNEVL